MSAAEALAPLVVLVADKISPTGLEPIARDDRFEVVLAAGWDEVQRDQALRRAHALLVRSATQVDRDLLRRAPALRVIGRAGVGVDNIDLEAATERGIPVLNAPAGNTVSAAELTFALLLSLARHVPGADASVRRGEWSRSSFGGAELRGKILGLVGAGRIGGEVARRAHAFGMEVIAYDPYLAEERAREAGIEPVELGDLIERADVVSLHVPLSDETTGMIGAEELARMKPTALLVNAARGGVVDEAALVEALRDGRIAGAALDVYAQEPLAEGSPLREAPNLVLTPHLGASTAEAQERVAVEIAEAVRDALLEGDLSRAVNAPAIGGEELRRLRPLMDLARKVGVIACALAPKGIRSVEMRSSGGSEGLKPLTASVLTGALERILGSDQVNYVNAIPLAHGRGIRVATSLVEDHGEYPQFLEVRVVADRGEVVVAGALLGEQHHPRIVRIDDYRLSVIPEGTLLVLKNRDVPGVIGRVGTLLGDHAINIAEYYQSRTSAGGDALAAVTVDGTIDPGLVEAIRSLDEISDVRVVELG